MNSRFIISTYCSGLERSRPNWWRTAATVSGVGLRPASERVGSTPGVAKKIRNVRTVIAKRTTTRPSRRRTMKMRHCLPTFARLSRSFARGSSASRTPSPSTFSDRTVSTIMIPGAIATHGRV